MSDPEHTSTMDSAAEAEMFDAIERDLKAMRARLGRARRIVQEHDATAVQRQAAAAGDLARHRVEKDKVTAVCEAKCAELLRGVAARESAVVERERAADEKYQRGEAQIRMAEMRAADLGNRERRSA